MTPAHYHSKNISFKSAIRFFYLAVAFGVALATSGCVFLAKDGPEAGALEMQASVTQKVEGNPVDFALVAANLTAIHATNEASDSLQPRFGAMAGGPGPDVCIGKGDIVSVTIFESEAGGLFVPKDGGSRQGNFVQAPNQQVDGQGQISVPFVAEPINAAGRTPREVGQEIARKLATRAIEPQVVVSVVDKRGNDVSVLGDVNAPAKFSLDPGGATLLAAIARAGGPKNPAYEETVSIQRNGRIHKAWMSAVVNDPKQNVAVRPGDVIFLAREQRVFMVLGATPTPGAIGGQNNRRFPFANARMSLSEALAIAGGLDSFRADPRQVFLFRLEPRQVLQKAGVDAGRFDAAFVPTVYSFDFSQGGTFFMADALDMRDRDLIFVSDAPATDMHKALSIVTQLSESSYFASQTYWATR